MHRTSNGQVASRLFIIDRDNNKDDLEHHETSNILQSTHLLLFFNA